VRDVISETWAFATDIAYGCHIARLAVGLPITPIDLIFQAISGSFRRPLGRMKHGESDSFLDEVEQSGRG